jgi:predicted Zn-ribbon and HTH transcriptional regulator
VDLAGSERQQHTQGNKTVDSKTFKEAVEINKSLFTLRQVISALTDNSSKINQANANPSGSKLKMDALQYVPYRESKLTTILKQSLGGNSFTLMIACLSPLDYFADENISTLNYATRAQRINNIPKMNIDPKVKQLMEQKKIIERL